MSRPGRVGIESLAKFFDVLVEVMLVQIVMAFLQTLEVKC